MRKTESLINIQIFDCVPAQPSEAVHHRLMFRGLGLSSRSYFQISIEHISCKDHSLLNAKKIRVCCMFEAAGCLGFITGD